MNLRVTVSCPLNPTEDEQKVERTLRNIFPEIATVTTEQFGDKTRLIAVGHDLKFLTKLRDLIRSQRIRSAARSILIRCTYGMEIDFHLNKQAAYVDRVSFSETQGESPLGPITVRIECDDPEAAVDFLAAAIETPLYVKKSKSSHGRLPHNPEE